MSQRGKKLLFSAASLGGAVLTAIVACILLLQEPSYHGKPIGYWLDQLPASYLEPGGHINLVYLGDATRNAPDAVTEYQTVVEAARTARSAVALLGTNCLRRLAARIEGESWLHTKMDSWKLRLQIQRPIMFSPKLRHPNERRAQALTAILDLGNRAEPIAPKLAVLARHKNPVVRAYALRALQATSQTGPKTLK